MRYIADLHIHSRYSRATSKASHLPGLAAWAAVKGIGVLATGDFTHPAWMKHLSENLEPAEQGFFKLSHWNRREIATLVPEGIRGEDLPVDDVRFLLSAEISSIYKKDGRVRKIHNILYVPDFDSARRINTALAGIGNLESDGRPILGLDARDLLEVMLENCPDGFLVPAHIWTPWFSLFGSKSGFDALEDCFADLSSEIFALETGLSSDPAMNRCISALDRYTLISNSDCHSPSKLGREANIFSTDLSFSAMQNALRSPATPGGKQVFTATVEFYPEEGKYHCDGHRKCHCCMEPHQTIRQKGLCPVCGKPVTVGVLHRVMELADRDSPVFPEHSPAVHSLIPLAEILGELLGVGVSSKKVTRAYGQLINKFGSEFNLLLEVPVGDINTLGSPLLAEAIDRVRTGRVIRQPGYDGEFGRIRVFDDDELSRLSGQLGLFGQPKKKLQNKNKRPTAVPARQRHATVSKGSKTYGLDSAQKAAVFSDARYILVQAGPGTGKTHTLVERIIRQCKQQPDQATVITFTNKAADEVRERLKKTDIPEGRVFVSTLHGYCLHNLRKQNPALRVAGPELRPLLLRQLFPALARSELSKLARSITDFLHDTSGLQREDPAYPLVQTYFNSLDARNLIDLEAIVPCMLALLTKGNRFSLTIRQCTGALYIDEFQDLNAVQYKLIHTLSTTSPIFAIGDPDQAIYGFRGADPRWFYQFKQDVNPEEHHLSYNYRCDKMIVEAANYVIANNSNPGPKAGACSKIDGRVVVRELGSPFAEARSVASRIKELLGGTSHREIEMMAGNELPTISLRDIGVLYRTTRQAEVIADVFFKQGLPYQVVDLEPFYHKEPVKVLYSWLLVAAGMADLSHLLFLLGLERGIGKATLDRIENDIGGQTGDPLSTFVQLADESDKLKQTGKNFLDLNKRVQEIARDDGVAAAMLPVLERYEISEDDVEVGRFLRLAGAIGNSVTDFADYLLNNGRSVIYDPKAEAVTLMTLHAAKGVEFPVVFLVGLEDELIPLKPRKQLTGGEYASHVEEERRLFFVGLTRAMHQLYLSWSRNGRGDQRSGKPSRFIAEIPETLYERLLPESVERQRYKQLSLFSKC